MSNEKPIDVSFVDARIVAAVEAANYTVRATRETGLKKGTYEVDFGKGQFFATLAVPDSGVTDKTLATLSERTASLGKVIANYEAPSRYGPVSLFTTSSVVSATAPKAG